MTMVNKLFAFLEFIWKLICYLLCFDYLYFRFPAVWFRKLAYSEKQIREKNIFFLIMDESEAKQKLGISTDVAFEVYVLDISGCLNVPAVDKKQAILEQVILNVYFAQVSFFPFVLCSK